MRNRTRQRHATTRRGAYKPHSRGLRRSRKRGNRPVAGGSNGPGPKPSSASEKVTYILESRTDDEMHALSDVIAMHSPSHASTHSRQRSQSRRVIQNRSARENKQVASSFLNLFGKNKGSYSPSVRKVLDLPTSGSKMHDIFGCDDHEYPLVRLDKGQGRDNTERRAARQPHRSNARSWLFRRKQAQGGHRGGNDHDGASEDCVYFTDPRARRNLLENLALQRKIDCAKIITPRQAQSNCWFNTMFVMFFISDKGRKFFQYFRAMMILGVRGSLLDMRASGSLEKAIQTLDDEGSEGDTMVLRPDMRRAFFYLNKAIDACLTGDEYAYTLNTNDIILQIHHAVVQANPQYASRVPSVGALGNPFTYYSTLMNFLSDNTVRVLQFQVHKDQLDYLEDLYDEIRHETKRSSGPPHLILVELFVQDEENNLLTEGGDPHQEMLEADDGVQYKLDAALVRSTNTLHWTCLLTCNGSGYAYDGASFTKFIPFDWKKKVLNLNASYSFNTRSIEYEYDFHQDTHTLVYYRHA